MGSKGKTFEPFQQREIGERLIKARETVWANIGPVEAARRLEVGQSTYSDHEGGKKTPLLAQAAHYALRLGISLDWLVLGKGQMFLTNSTSNAPFTLKLEQIPLISPHNVMHLREIVSGSQPLSLDMTAAPDGADRLKRMFGLKQLDNAMTRSLFPSYPPGTTYYINPDVVPQPGDTVVVYLAAIGHAVARRYERRQESGKSISVFVPFNPAFETIEARDESEALIVGRVVGHNYFNPDEANA